MSDDLKDRILETAESLFDARGVRDVTIDDVCRQLSISKKTFYQFYAQKEDLVGAVVQKRIADSQQYFSRIFRGKNAVEIFWILYDRAFRKYKLS